MEEHFPSVNYEKKIWFIKLWETCNVISYIALSLIKCFNNPNISVGNRTLRRRNHVQLAACGVSHGRTKYGRISYFSCLIFSMCVCVRTWHLSIICFTVPSFIQTDLYSHQIPQSSLMSVFMLLFHQKCWKIQTKIKLMWHLKAWMVFIHFTKWSSRKSMNT